MLGQRSLCKKLLSRGDGLCQFSDHFLLQILGCIAAKQLFTGKILSPKEKRCLMNDHFYNQFHFLQGGATS